MKNGVKKIQTAGYNGACTVYELFNEKNLKDLTNVLYKKIGFESQNFAIFDLQYQIKPNI